MHYGLLDLCALTFCRHECQSEKSNLCRSSFASFSIFFLSNLKILVAKSNTIKACNSQINLVTTTRFNDKMFLTLIFPFPECPPTFLYKEASFSYFPHNNSKLSLVCSLDFSLKFFLSTLVVLAFLGSRTNSGRSSSSRTSVVVLSSIEFRQWTIRQCRSIVPSLLHVQLFYPKRQLFKENLEHQQ